VRARARARARARDRDRDRDTARDRVRVTHRRVEHGVHMGRLLLTKPEVVVHRLGRVVKEKAVDARPIEVGGTVAAKEHECLVERLSRGLAMPDHDDQRVVRGVPD
tara:strand:+ start:156 stop:473 length:318 start_codon:yes stop_codon:yes gene_type:complete